MKTEDPKSKSPAPTTETIVRVYNRSTRQSFTHEVKNGEEVKKYVASPSSFATVPRVIADRWMRLFPETIIEAAIAQRELGGSAAELALVRAELATAQARIAALEKENAQLKAASQV